MNYSAHNTAHELEFLGKLGTYSEKQALSRLELLEEYKFSMRLRKNWGDISPVRILEALDKQIAFELLVEA